MKAIQVRLTKGQIELLDKAIELGDYPTRSEAIRDAVRIVFNNKKK